MSTVSSDFARELRALQGPVAVTHLCAPSWRAGASVVPDIRGCASLLAQAACGAVLSDLPRSGWPAPLARAFPDQNFGIFYLRVLAVSPNPDLIFGVTVPLTFQEVPSSLSTLGSCCTCPPLCPAWVLPEEVLQRL